MLRYFLVNAYNHLNEIFFRNFPTAIEGSLRLSNSPIKGYKSNIKRMIKFFSFSGFYVRFILNIFFFVQVTRLLVFPRCWQMSTVQLLISNPEWTDCLCSVLSHPYNTGSSSTPRFRPMDWWVSCFYSYNWNGYLRLKINCSIYFLMKRYMYMLKTTYFL